MRPRQIRLPKTPTRARAISFITLLYYLSPNPTTGLDFKGEIYKPGAWIEEKDLWPTPDYPVVPIALEMTEADYVDYNRPTGHRKIPAVFVVWIYEQGEWREVAKHIGHGLEWVPVLAPTVRKLLDEHAPPRRPVEMAPIMHRIISVVLKELHDLPRNEDRCELLQCVHEFLAGQLAHEKTGSQMPLEWDRHFEGR